MAIRRSFSPTMRAQTRHFNGNSLRNSTHYNFRIQSTPSLSLQQYVRSSTIRPGAQQWQPPGIYRTPHFHSYLSPERRKQPETLQVNPWIYAYRRKHYIPTYSLKNYKDLKPKPTEPIWYPPSHYQAKRPKSLSPEKRPEERIREPIWRPPSRYQYKQPKSLSPEKRPEERIREPIWHPSGPYRDKRPKPLSPEKKPEERIREPIWHPPGPYRDKRPKSLSPEKRRQELIREPVWNPAGKIQHKPVPYFDPPNLRWSLRELLKSMPEMRSKAHRVSRSVTVMRRSQDIKGT